MTRLISFPQIGALLATIAFSIAAHAAPPNNDNFAKRTPLVGENVRATSDNREATIEPGEPTHNQGEGDQHTVWWTWTAPATGKVTIDTADIAGLPRYLGLGIYVGDTLDTLLPVTEWRDKVDSFRLVFPVEGGRVYHIVSNGPNGDYAGQPGFNLHFVKTSILTPVMGRDKFADRVALSGSEVFAVSDNRATTIEPGEPTHNQGEANQRTVWWTWTAPTTGKVAIDATGSAEFSGLVRYLGLGIYVGDTLDTLLPVTEWRDKVDSFRLVFPVEGGRVYHIVSNGPNGDYIGQLGFNLHFAKTATPPPILGRDRFADRAVLSGPEAFAVSDNRVTKIEPGEPKHNPGEGVERTVWWTWTAPATGKVAIDTTDVTKISGISRYLALAVYKGNEIDSLTSVVEGRYPVDSFKLGFPVEGGQVYQIVSNAPNGDYIGQLGFNLHFRPSPTVGMDKFAVRAPIKGSEGLAVASNEKATIDEGEPVHTPDSKDNHTIWWTWTAPADGKVAIDTVGIGDSTRMLSLAVYKGGALTALTPIAKKSGKVAEYQMTFNVEDGIAYQIVSNDSDADGRTLGKIGFNLHFQEAK